MPVREISDHLVALIDGATVLASTALSLACALGLFVAIAHRRRHAPGLFEMVLPPGPAPAGELVFAHLQALLRAHAGGLLRPPCTVVLRVWHSASGLHLGLSADIVVIRRIEATLDTIWPGARLVAANRSMPMPSAAMEWHPSIDQQRVARPVPGADVALTRALMRAEVGEELSLEFVLRASDARERRPIGDLVRSAPPHTSVIRGRGERTERLPSGVDRLECQIRIRARAASDVRARSLVRELEPSVRVLSSGSGVSLGVDRRHRRRLLAAVAGLGGDPVSPAELTHLLPLACITKAIAASSEQATAGERLLGVRSYAGATSEVRLSIAGSRHHLHVLGPTGTGKSTLLLNLIAQDIVSGRGCAVLDPKGDLVREVITRIPRTRLSDVVYVGPLEHERAVGINPLALAPDEDRHLAAENVLSIFKRLYAHNWGPRTDDVLKSCVLTLIDVPGSTIAHIPALLTDRALRLRFTARVDDAIGLGSFWRWYERVSEAKRTEVTAPLQNKLRDFLVRPRLRRLLCQERSTVDLATFMDRGGILLVDLATGRWGETASQLAGSFLVARLWQAALARQSIREEQRRDFLLYVDEFQSFLGMGGPFADALAQARGLRLSLTLANQHLGQLPREIRDAVAANARSRITFRCAPSEAAAVAKEFAPLEPASISALPPFEAAARLVSATSALTLRTLPTDAAPAGSARADEVLRASAARYGRDIRMVDQALRQLLGTDVGEEPSRARVSRT